jgi:cbb3-type cytochrome oxidase maturation protein
MEVLAYLVPLALTLGLLGLGAFLWSLKTGQYDDLEGAAWRAIMDEDTRVAAVDRPVDGPIKCAVPVKARSAEH